MSSTGRLDILGIGKESSYGNGASAAHWLPMDSLNFKDVAPKIEDTRSRGRIEASAGSKTASKSSECTGEGIASSGSIGMLLLAALGTVSTTGTDPYTHAFSVLNTNDPKSFSLTPGNVGQRSLLGEFDGSILDSLEISVAAEQWINFSVKFMGKIGSGSTTQAPSIASESDFTANQISFKRASAITGLDAASAFSVRSAKISFSKSAKLRMSTGTLEPVTGKNGDLDIDGEFELEFDNADERTKFIADTKEAARFEMEDDTVDLGGGVHPKLKIDLAQISIRDWGVSGGNSDILTQVFSFKGSYSDDAGKSVEAELINDIASY